MNPEVEFVEAISKKTADISLRLIYADWCDEQGDPRGEFIRIQCELADGEGLPSKVRHLKRREAELLQVHRRKWDSEIHLRLARTPLCNQIHRRRGLIRRWKYHRGFVEYAVVEAEAFLEFPEAVFQIGPLRRLRVLQGENRIEEIMRSPFLKRLQIVEINTPNSAFDATKRRIGRLSRFVPASTQIFPTPSQPISPPLIRNETQTFLGITWRGNSMPLFLVMGLALMGSLLCIACSVLLGIVLERLVLKLNLGPLFY